MKTQLSRAFFGIATAVENITTLTAAIIVLWIFTRSFTIGRAEANVLNTVYWVFEHTLMLAWISALVSMSSMSLVTKSSASAGTAGTKTWAWASLVFNILVTFLAFATPRIGATAGPP